LGGVLFFVLFFGMRSDALAKWSGTGYGGNSPACTIYANSDEIDAGEGTTLTWDVNDKVVRGYLHPKGSTSWMQEVDLNGSWWISGITDTREYTLTVEADDGQTADCSTRVKVREGQGDELTCNIFANPNEISSGEGVNLIWNSTGNVVEAFLHPTNSTHVFANVAPNGSWWISGITDSRSYSLTVLDDKGNSVTCNALVSVR